MVRKEGWPEWIRLDDEPLTEKTFAWDTTAFPSGSYRLKLTASDRPSNSPVDALSRERESLAFLVDHDSPSVTVTPTARGASIALKDALTRLVKADYALDGGPWTPSSPTTSYSTPERRRSPCGSLTSSRARTCSWSARPMQPATSAPATPWSTSRIDREN